jgi:hypothetical protein
MPILRFYFKYSDHDFMKYNLLLDKIDNDLQKKMELKNTPENLVRTIESVLKLKRKFKL